MPNAKPENPNKFVPGARGAAERRAAIKSSLKPGAAPFNPAKDNRSKMVRAIQAKVIENKANITQQKKDAHLAFLNKRMASLQKSIDTVNAIAPASVTPAPATPNPVSQKNSVKPKK